jgi:NADPH-dependent curcumin reductase CurA
MPATASPATITAREFHLIARPDGEPTAEHFALVEGSVRPLAAGEVRVRNTHLSVDPYMRGRMDDVESYVPPFPIGAPLEGAAIGVVVESRDDGLAPGDVVAHWQSWRELAIGPAGEFERVEVAPGIPPSAFLGVLGTPGLAAYVGIADVARVGVGDTVYVSAAAGAVGSVAAQIARMRGARRVVGSAGGAEKVAWLTEEAGFDAAFNHRDGALAEQLRDAAPDGVDVVFDNVGGDHLEAAIDVLNVHGRVVLCGYITSHHTGGYAAGPRNLSLLVTKRIATQGILVTDHIHKLPAYRATAQAWLRDGRLRFRETVVDGIEQMPDALLGLYRGDNVGKMVVRVDPVRG